MKQKQITVEVSDLIVELDQILTKALTEAAKAENVEPDAYVLTLIQKHFFPETTESAPETPPMSLKANEPARTRTPKSSKPKYAGKLSELLAFGDEGNDIAMELKNKGLISTEQYEVILNGEIPKGKLATISQDAQKYIVEQLNKMESGSGSEIGDGKNGAVAGGTDAGKV